MVTFKHFPYGSAIGTGDCVFRHYGNESPYIPFTPPDEDTFPVTLNGFFAEPLHGNASGSSSSYHGSVYAKPWLSQPAKKLGKCYSSWGNSVDNFSNYRYGTVAVGYSADSTSAGTQAFNVWWEDLTTGKSNVSQVNTEIDAANITILYELFESDGSVWNAVKRVSDGVCGYYNSVTNTFASVKDMDAEPQENGEE